MHEYKGSLDATDKSFAIVAGRFNESLVQRLVDGAVDCLARLGADEDDIEVYWVPGSFEVPGAAQVIAAAGNVDAVIGLGCLIRGETSHYDLVAQQAASGIAGVMKETGVPCIFGIVTAENPEQAEARCGGKMGNRGWDAAQAAVEMCNVSEAFDVPEYDDMEYEPEDDAEDEEELSAEFGRHGGSAESLGGGRGGGGQERGGAGDAGPEFRGDFPQAEDVKNNS